MLIGVVVPAYTIFSIAVLAGVPWWRERLLLVTLVGVTCFAFGWYYSALMAAVCSLHIYLKEFLPYVSRIDFK